MTLLLLEDDWAKTRITYFPFYNVKVSVKIRDLGAHFAVAGQTHSGLVSYLIPSINPGVSTVLFCHDQCYKVTHTAQRSSTSRSGNWPMRSLNFHWLTNERTALCPCHTWPVEVVMTWSCDERFMTCIHDTISCASDWLEDYITGPLIG